MLTVTAGSDRIVTVRAFDAASVETHRGADTITVVAGINPALNFTLTPLTGDVPIVVTIAGLRIVVAPTPDTLVAGGQTHRLIATVTTSAGAPVSATVQWATLDPAIAVVDTGGTVTGVTTGSTMIIASYAGVAAAATVTVLRPEDVPPVLQRVGPTFMIPLFVTAPPGDTLRVFVVQQDGRVWVLRRDTLLAAPFLDLTGLISCCDERGLLGMAFHPQYASNGFFFVNFTDVNGHTRVVRYHVSADPNIADLASASPVLFQTQPFANHNGGWLGFGPDGFLYVALGDGGSGGDPLGFGQNMNSWLGKILRINVDAAGYTVPASNPFIARTDTLPEIWASGLRHPWRPSFDRATGDLYIADVGQGLIEEIDRQPAGAGGRNYGWNLMEGSSCYTAGCSPTGFTLPVHEYTHADGCSVTGGYFYRGQQLPGIAGRYFYSDYCEGWVRSFRWDGNQDVEHTEWPALAPGGNITSFGEDGRGELYIVQRVPGEVYRFVPSRR